MPLHDGMPHTQPVFWCCRWVEMYLKDILPCESHFHEDAVVVGIHNTNNAGCSLTHDHLYTYESFRLADDEMILAHWQAMLAWTSRSLSATTKGSPSLLVNLSGR